MTIVADTHMTDSIANRRAAMSVLGQTATANIAAHLDPLDLPSFQRLREPETGLVMVRGRIGGDGAPFNLGEATVARAAVRLDSGQVGFGYTLGRDASKAELIALCDALLQTDDFAATITHAVLTPLKQNLADQRARKAAETAATRVDFYTLVRGEG